MLNFYKRETKLKIQASLLQFEHLKFKHLSILAGCFLLLASSNLSAQDTLVITYSGSHLPVWNEWQPAADSAVSPCAGSINVNIPIGMWIDSVDVSYEITSNNAPKNQQRSRLVSPGTNTGEEDYFAGTGNSSGTQTYHRTGLTQFAGLTGNVDFLLDVKRNVTFGNEHGMCSPLFVYVNNNTWTIKLYLSGSLTCETPYNIIFPTISGYNAIIAWQETGDGSAWELGVDTTGQGVSSLFGITAASPYHEISGLTPETEYHIYLRSVCDANNYSDWFGPFSFTTFPGNFMQLTHTSGLIPSIYESSVNTQTVSPCAGSLKVQLPAGFWITEVDVEYTLTSINGAFVYEQRSRLLAPEYGLGEEAYSLFVGVLGGMKSYFREGLEMFYGIAGEVEFLLDVKRVWGSVPSDCNTTYVFANQGTWMLSIYIDSISACLEPLHLDVQTVTDSSAVLNWTALGSPESWELEYGPVGFIPSGIPDITGITTIPYELTGLSPFTHYDVYLRANCGPLGHSDWSGPMSVITHCQLPGITTKGDTICGTAEAVLIAQASIPGIPVIWYDAPTGGNIVGYGDTLNTPALSSNTTYWVQAYTDTATYQIGAPDLSIGNTTLFSVPTTAHGLLFEAYQPVHIESLTIYPIDSGDVEIEIRTYPGNELIDSKIISVTGDSVTPFIAHVDFHLEPGNYRIGRGSASTVLLVHNSTGAQYPYLIDDILSINSGTTVNNQYYFFYNWNVKLVCNGGRTPVEVTANAGLSLGIPDTFNICEGEMMTLYVPDGFSFYAWMVETASGTNFYTTPSLQISGSGIYTLTVLDDDNCSAVVSSQITVNPLPEMEIISSPQPVCQGGSMMLTATGNTDSLIWSHGITDQEPFFIEDSTLFTVIGFLAGCTDTAEIAILPLPLPEVIFEPDNTTVICSNQDQYELAGGLPEGGTYEGEGVDNNIFYPSQTGAGTHTISYSYTDENGCTGTALADISVEVCDAVPEVSGGLNKVYPNPFSQQLTVELEEVQGLIEHIKLVDLKGRTWLQFSPEVQLPDTQIQSLDLGWLPAGVYYLVVVSDISVYRQAVIKAY